MPDIFYVAMLIVCFHGDCTRFDFEKDKPEDIKITYAGCDTTQRRPEDNNWKIIPDVDKDLIPNQNDLKWQQQKGKEI
jgi:hypothetical protein